jgi:hypothetical protein
MVPVAPVTTGITFTFIFHMRLISIVRFLYFMIFSAPFLITSVSCNTKIYQYTCSSFITTDYDVRFIVSNGSVDLHLVIPPYLHDQFLLISVHVHSSVHYLILPIFPSIYCSVVDHTLWHVSLCIVLEGNVANESNMAKWPLRNGAIIMTTDGTCSTSERLGSVCDNTFHLKAYQQATSSPQGNMMAVKVADVIAVK